MAFGGSLPQINLGVQCVTQGGHHSGAQRVNPEFRVESNFRIIPEQYFSGVGNVVEFLENMDNNLTYYEIPTQLTCAYLKGHLTGRALDWFEVLGYRVVEDKATNYAHLKQVLSEQFPVVRNTSELETRFFASSQNHNQKPSYFVYDLLKIHKILKLEMTEEKLIDHIISRLEPQILDYVEVGSNYRFGSENSIKPGNFTFLTICNTLNQCILGIDFMKESKLTLDFDQKSLIIPDDQIKQLPKVVKPVEIELSDTKLGDGQKQKLRNLFSGFKGLFSDQPGLTHVLYHEIDTVARDRLCRDPTVMTGSNKE
ncbi:uncharacterized protein TNCV_3903601 [Trichonephila clavipes]|nr:uncharacterized protein TNCV_3903601 [Trichonephila clavipes]